MSSNNNTKPSIKLNFIMNAVLMMSSVLFPLITFPYVSRILMPDGMGKVAFATSFVSYFSLFAQLGIPTYGIRACAQVRDDKEKLTRVAHELLMINLIMNVFVYAALFAAVLTIPRLQEEKTLYAVISASIILTSIGMEWLYKALEKYTYITIRSIIFKALSLVFLFILIHNKDDYVLYGAITIFAASASNIFNLLNAHKYIGFKPVGGYDLKQHLKPVFVFFAMACATTIYTQLDTVMLGFMTTDHDVGLYDVAARVKTILVYLVTSLGTVLLPRASYNIEKGFLDEFWRLSRKAIEFVFYFATPILLFFIINSDYVVYALAGNAFGGAILPLKVLMPTLLLIGLTNIMGLQILVPMGQEKKVLYSVTLGALVDASLNYVLIPSLSATGAAIGTLVAEFAVLVYQYVVLRDEVKDIFKRVNYLRLIVALGLASGLTLLIRMASLNLYVSLVIAGICFFGSYVLYLIIRKDQLAMEVLDSFFKLIKHR